MKIPYVDKVGEDGGKRRTIEEGFSSFQGADDRCKEVLQKKKHLRSGLLDTEEELHCKSSPGRRHRPPQSRRIHRRSSFF